MADRVCPCGVPIPYAGVGQPRKFCSPECKRRDKNAKVTALRNEERSAREPTTCRTCGDPIPWTGRPGGPARFCSAACKEAKPVAAGRTCHRCHQHKKAGCFSLSPRSADGLRSWCKSCVAEYNAGRRDRNILLERRSRYGISIEDQEAMWAEQEGRCASCGHQFELPRKAHLDHNHQTGEVRAYLCAACNHIVGRCREDPEHLDFVIAYLQRKG